MEINIKKICAILLLVVFFSSIDCSYCKSSYRKRDNLRIQKNKKQKKSKYDFKYSVKKPGELIIGKCSTYKNTRKSAINPKIKKNYVAMRWDYNALIKHWGIKRQGKKSAIALVKEKLSQCKVQIVHYDKENNATIIRYGYPADWGPNPSLDRSVDLCPHLAKSLNVDTDDIVHVQLID